MALRSGPGGLRVIPAAGVSPGPGLVPALPRFLRPRLQRDVPGARSGASALPSSGAAPSAGLSTFFFFPIDLCLRRFPNIFLWILFYAVFHSEMCGNSKLCAYQKHLLLKQILSTTKFPGLDTPQERSSHQTTICKKINNPVNTLFPFPPSLIVHLFCVFPPILTIVS